MWVRFPPPALNSYWYRLAGRIDGAVVGSARDWVNCRRTRCGLDSASDKSTMIETGSEQTAIIQPVIAPAPVGTARLVALDAFRGMTVAAMVIVNNPGTWSAMYWPLEHAEWNGWTPTDLIFPFFLFIVGVSLTFSRQTLDAPVWRIVRRAIVLVALGLLLTGFPRFDLHQWRFTGILPRIAFCYLAAALIYRATSPQARSPRGPRADGKQAIVLASIAMAILVAYWIALTRLGDFTPEGNVGAAIDRRLLGSHLYRSGRWDPEGLFSSVPAIATTLLGVLSGMCLGSASPIQQKLRMMFVGGAALILAGELWNVWLPINKNLWTSSYVLLTGGAAAIVLAACLYVIDIRGRRRWAHPFVVFGTNAIALFVVSGLIAKASVVWKLQGPLYQRAFAWIASPKNASLLYSLAFLAVMYAMCAALYRRRIFLRV
jgi:predicted acyltransferase